ncbi:dNA polymerase III subunit gamma and tau [Dialister sp. CAG:588]|nr:dNA polymerase III subunit gamma and tau [Dialister sp. CAG:588]
MWKDILSCIMSIPRIDVFTCFQKGKLIYVGGARAVISVPQKFLVLAGNNKSYQKVISDAFQKVTGTAYTPKTVLAGTTEEDEVLSLLNKADSDSMTEEIKESSQDSYKKIEISDIPEKDRNADVLAEALKLMPDCDIYEKIE